MTDLEMTRLCAEAMGLKVGPQQNFRTPAFLVEHPLAPEAISTQRLEFWCPLENDEQAMGLVKRFRLTVVWVALAYEWGVSRDAGALHDTFASGGKDLNRAICEYVARMQAEKVPA
jgi:hypothetical protein